jgi:uncharacterized membrane protein
MAAVDAVAADGAGVVADLVAVARPGGGEMDLDRVAKHLLTTRRRIKRCLTDADLAAIDSAIAESATLHGAHIHFAIEPALHPVQLWRDVAPRERAIELFSELRVWDTEHNSGVLIYVLLADRAIEILADRNVHVHVGAARWAAIMDAMRADFASDRYQDGVLGAIVAVRRELAAYLASSGAGNAEA